ncbi:MAG: DUF1565 domain-containing protein [Planctomycetota bacterium]
MLRIVASLLALSLSLPCANAQFAYVDSVSGDDSNDGLTSATAWRTLTRATTGPSSATTIVVAPGVHDAALGEVFPIVVPSGVIVVGPQGAVEPAVIDAGGAPIAIDFAGPDGGGFGEFVVEDAAVGVRSVDADVRLFDLLVRGCRRAVEISTRGQAVDAEVDDLTVLDCGEGLVAEGFVSLSLFDCLFDSIATNGVRFAFDPTGIVGDFAFRQLVAIRCRFDRCDGVGLDIAIGGTEAPDIELLQLQALRSDTGIRMRVPVPAAVSSRISLGQSTVAANGIGLDVESVDAVGIEQSVVDANGLDVRATAGSAVAAQSHVGDGSIPAPSSGSARLVDPTGGDLRPSFASPVIDRNLNPGPTGIDGNLDLVPLRDWGALELQTLSEPQFVHLGGTARFEVFGPQFATAVGLVGDLGNFSVATRYGDLRLVPSTVRRQSAFPIEPGPAPTVWEIPVPNDPSLLGLHGVQVWVPSSISPTDGALTTSAWFLVLP